MIPLVALALCLVLVPLAGGRWGAVASLRLPHEGLVLALFVLQGLARGRLWPLSAAGPWAQVVWATTGIALVLIFWRSVRVPGVALIVLGLALNVLVVLANGGMPYYLDGGKAVPAANAFYVLGTPHSVLIALADVLPDPTGAYLVSVGDILLGIGAIVLVVSTSLGAYSGNPAKGGPISVASTD